MPDLTASVSAPASISVAVGVPIANTTLGIVPHASTHAANGNDPISPSSIGALSVGDGIAYAIALG